MPDNAEAVPLDQRPVLVHAQVFARLDLLGPFRLESVILSQDPGRLEHPLPVELPGLGRLPPFEEGRVEREPASGLQGFGDLGDQRVLVGDVVDGIAVKDGIDRLLDRIRHVLYTALHELHGGVANVFEVLHGLLEPGGGLVQRYDHRVSGAP